MAGLDPAIHVFVRLPKNVDARDEPGHDDDEGCLKIKRRAAARHLYKTQILQTP